MLTGKQIAALSELLHASRPDWDTRGIQAALRRTDDTWAWPAVCIHAITVAANAANQTPDAIARPQPATGTRPVDHGQPCPTHNGTIRRADGRWHCCWLADRTPPEPYEHRPHPAPAGLREQIRADIAARRPEHPAAGTPATPEHATSGHLSEGVT